MKDPQKLLKFELKTLKDSTKGINDIPLTISKNKRNIKISKIVGFLLMLTCFFTATTFVEYPIITIIIAAFSGCLITFGVISEMSIEQYPYIAKHLDINSLQSRIEEIEKEIML